MTSLQRRATGVLAIVASVAFGLTVPGGLAAAETSGCKMARIAELPVRLVRNKLVVDGAINGQKIGVMLDTGATITLIPRPAAIRLGLGRQKVSGYRMFGIGGETEVESALVDEFRMGQATFKGRRMIVTGEHDPGDDVAVILGEDVFQQVDIEFDLVHGAVRLFRPVDCGGVSLAYWARDGASEVGIETIEEIRPRIVLTVRINGQPVRALLDSGASASVLDKPEAARLGIDPEVSRVAAGKITGAGEKRVEAWVVPLQSFAIGDEVIKDTTIQVSDVSRGMSYSQTGSLVPRKVEGAASMILGADFLRAHRVLVAHSQRKLYFTYAGGPVFQRIPPAKDDGGVNP